MATPEFEQIEPGLWVWRDWVIALIWGEFFLLTAATRELGPFRHFDQALTQAAYLA